MIKILYIEDNSDDVRLICSLANQIKEFSPLVIETSLPDGLDRIKKINFDCIFLDLSLPDSFGLESLDVIKKAQPDVPIVVCTGMNDQETALQAINKGAQDFFLKGEITEKLLRKTVFYSIERHKSQTELKIAQNNLTKAENLAKMGNWEFILESERFLMSAGMEKILDLKNSDQIKVLDDYLAFVLPSNRLKVKRTLNKLIKTKKTVNYSERIRTSADNDKILYTTTECRLNEQGEVLSIFGATIDVTESNRTEYRLKESEQKLLEAQELAKIGNWEYDFKNEEFSGSPEAYKIFDLVFEDGIDNNALSVINDMTWGSDSVRIYKTITKHIESKEPFSLEFKIGTREGQIKHIKATAKIFENAEKTGKKMRGTIQDISTLKEAEEVKEQFTRKLEAVVKKRTSELTSTKARLEESLEKEKQLGELKSRFVSTASHQFRTPLTVINSSIGLLDMQLETAPENLKAKIAKTTERVKNEVARMINIMNEVLILGKIEASKISVNPLIINPVELIESVIQSHNDIQTDGRKAQLIKSGKQRSIKIDPNLFEHVISNLLSNAFKYSKDKKAPQVIIDFKTKAITIDVVDFGLGIPKDEISSVFEPFFRATNANQISGTGLGTAIVKEYIDLLEGAISLQSQVNKGSNFKIEFKL